MPQAILQKLSVAELKQELQRRERNTAELMRTRKELVDRLAKVDAQLAALSGSVVTRSKPKRATTRGRKHSKKTLTETLISVLDTKTPMSIEEILTAVQRAGYKSSSKNFRVIVSQTLIKDERFLRASRGKYLLKG